jgi:hypothetical protein
VLYRAATDTHGKRNGHLFVRRATRMQRRPFDSATAAWRGLRPRRHGADHAVPVTGNAKGFSANAEPKQPPGWKMRLRALPRRILLNEDRSIPVLAAALGVAVELTANLRMYVARPSAIAGDRDH